MPTRIHDGVISYFSRVWNQVIDWGLVVPLAAARQVGRFCPCAPGGP